MGPEHFSTSRRYLVQVAAAGLASTVAAPAMAQDAGQKPAPDKPTPQLQDPRITYVKPPFPPQSQPWPGLACRMDPKPDHGETSYYGSGKLAGRKVLITGGDSGIGRAVAIAYAREGADVAISYLPEEEQDAREVVEYITQAGRKAVALPGDIRSEAFCGKMVTDALQGLGGLDILVSNAARQHAHDSILDITSEDLDWTLKTNIYAMFWITKAAIPHMPAGSAIIMTSSANAYSPTSNLLDYATSKGAIVTFAKGLAKQMAALGIRVNAVAPGPVWTPLQVCGGQSVENLKIFGAGVPLGRPAEPVEMAPAYVLLASAEASYMTGQILGVNGGMGEP